MANAYVYSRVCSEGEDALDALQRQRDSLVEFAEENGYKIVGEWSENTAWCMSEDALSDIGRINDLEGVDALIVLSSDRLGRSRDGLIRTVEYMLDHGIKIHGLMEGTIDEHITRLIDVYNGLEEMTQKK